MVELRSKQILGQYLKADHDAHGVGLSTFRSDSLPELFLKEIMLHAASSLCFCRGCNYVIVDKKKWYWRNVSFSLFADVALRSDRCAR